LVGVLSDMVWEMWGRWDLVLVNVILFSLFLLFMPFRRRVWGRAIWSARGAFVAFLISLFTEMYGLPLTVYILTPLLLTNIESNEWMLGGHLFGWPGIVIGTPILLIGALLIIKGWVTIHKAISTEERLVTDSIYGVVRHPQYLGLLLFTLGWLIHWPTIIGAAMWPLLALLYYRLAKREDRELESVFGEEYRRYRETVPMFIPKIVKKWLLSLIKR